MARPSEDDRDAIDRAFADLVAGYHLTADRPDSPVSALDLDVEPPAQLPPAQLGPTDAPSVQFHFPPRDRPEAAPPATRPDPPYQPEPLPPMPRPSLPVLLGWIGIGYAMIVVLAGISGITVSTIAGWLAIGGFAIGFSILLTHLPRHRPPGDGAVL